jgi:general secretion pathway protein G
VKRRSKAEAFFSALLIASSVFGLTAYTGAACGAAVRKAKEAALQQYLWTMRRAIDSYANDKGKAPQSLNDLVSDGYLREIPVDPFTMSNKTWIIELEEKSSAPNRLPGIIDVHSGAAGAAISGSLIIGFGNSP